MPLPPSVPREALHLRRITLRGYRRLDGLYDIEAQMVDTKSEAIAVGGGRVVAPGAPIHDMSIRLVLDVDLLVMDVVACTDASPHGICQGATLSLQCLKGLRIGSGWSKAIRERLGGRKGCTHLTELLKPLATVAFQTLWQVRQAQPVAVDAAGRPRKIDSCHAYASDREIVQMRWPMHFDGIPVK